MSTIDTLMVKVGIDAGELEDGAERATSSVRGIGDGADRSRPSVDDYGRGLDGVGERADELDTRMMGLSDGITGVSDLMKGDLGPAGYAMAMADIGSSVYNFVVPSLKTAKAMILENGRAAVTSAASHVRAAALTAVGWVKMGIQATINAARMAAAWLISLGPVGLVIAAIAAIIAILVALGVGFDDIARWATAAWGWILGAAQAVWHWLADNWPLVLAILTGPIGIAVFMIVKHWDTIRNAVGAALGWIGDKATAVKDWIVGRFGDIVAWVWGMPSRIWSAAVGLFDGFKDAFRGAVNAIIGWWNGLSFTLPSITVPEWDPPGPGPTFGGFTIGGQTFGTPDIGYLAKGGIVRHRPGGILANIGEGSVDEAVIPLPRGMRAMGAGGGPPVTLNVTGSILAERDIVRIVRDELGRRGFGGVR